MKNFGFIVWVYLGFISMIFAECVVPKGLSDIADKTSISELKQFKDVQRNIDVLAKMCLYKVSFTEGKYDWKMLLVTHPKNPKGAFWYLPHDDENEAFDSAVYATQKYGGGFLAVMANDQRNFKGQDPNRNFGQSTLSAKLCKEQRSLAPLYSKNVFAVIDTFRNADLPYLALHNNENGWYGNGGKGTISILRSSKIAQAYPAKKEIKIKGVRLNDEDTLIYIAGTTNKPNSNKLNQLLKEGINTKYEVVSQEHNDCSMSNYVILTQSTTNYYNIETQKGDFKTQKYLIDKILSIVK